MKKQYLKYAIGEILLVVIGILIALAINNLNEDRKDRRIEEGLLQEMLVSLQKDQALFSMFIQRIDRKDTAINASLNFLKYAGPNDEIKANQISPVFIGVRLSYDKGPYEELISIGADKITDTELRSNIIRYYQVTLPRGENFMDEINQRHELRVQALEKELADLGLMDKAFYEVDSGHWEIDRRVIPNARKLVTSALFKHVLKIEGEVSQSYRSRLGDIVNGNDELIKQLRIKLDQ